MEKRQQGFTLLEVMIVLIVVPVLAAITLPLYQNYIAKAQVTVALADITPGGWALKCSSLKDSAPKAQAISVCTRLQRAAGVLRLM